MAAAALLASVSFETPAPSLAAQYPNRIAQPHVYGSSVAILVRDMLAAGPRAQVGNETLNAEPLRRVYEARGYEPIWSGSPNAEANAKLVLDALREASSEGLRAEDYRLAQLSARAVEDSEKAKLELLMTDSLLRYAHDLRSGRVRPADVEEDIKLPELGFDFPGALAGAASSGTIAAFLADLPPKHGEYQHLKLALARYRAIEAAGGWPVVPQGATPDGENAGLLRARLVAEDEAVDHDRAGLTDALKRYQQRNGLADDGRLGPKTLAALNVPVATRIGQIAANMERWRWMPRELEPRRITVNVADATLQVIDGSAVVLGSKVVVGGPNWRTPILRADVTAITVNPAWHVPPSIARREIWPKQRANPPYLRSQGLVVVDGQLRQPPGPGNALGQIKLEMPNDFGVYLHDTPTKAAFAKETRTLSHGCVRVEQITALASLAIVGDAQSGLDQLSQLIATRTTTRIDLRERIPVYLLYWTAVADEDGRIGFRNDVYDRDARLISALEGAQTTPRTVAELDV